MAASRGRFITVEGIEGVGKSTHIDRLVTRIESEGYPVLRTREPGGTPAAERIREVVLAAESEPVPAAAELLLMFAARAFHVDNLIRPALAAGTWVVSDRFVDASRAYQSGGRGLSMARIDYLAEWVLGDLVPDLTLLLDAPVATALARTRQRAKADRLDGETAAFYDRVRDAYLALAAAEPTRFVIVDAAIDVDRVAQAIERATDRLFEPAT